MRLSNYFVPMLKEDPIDATIISHKLMIRTGMIRQQNSGIYYWLPLGLKILEKIKHIINSELKKCGCIEILMPCIQPADLWQESKRYDAYGKEMLRIKDRHNNEMLFGPTNEEAITDIVRKNIFSYKDLPKNFFHIQWKFRDEIRPRYGIMRGREFLMKDGYSFDIDMESAELSYKKMFSTYISIFKKLGLTAIPVRAVTGAIGGNLSHEFHIIAKTGESKIYYDKRFNDLLAQDKFDYEQFINTYSAADEMHEPEKCTVKPEDLIESEAIEVGHIFCFGDKYTKAMNATVTDKNGNLVHPSCGSYGIGVSRLVGAFIEANHDENGIIWPKQVSPFDLSLINLNINDELSTKLADDIYEILDQNYEILYDDTDARVGAKLSSHDLLGFPWQIIIGPKSASRGYVELKNRKSGEKQEMTKEELLNFFSELQCLKK